MYTFILGIDQSLSATGISLIRASVEDGAVTVSREFDTTLSSSRSGVARLQDICDMVVQKGIMRCSEILTLATLEAPAQMANSPSLSPLTELLGCLKLTLFENEVNYYVQNQSSMKKFCLGHGDAKKDSGYLLRVLEATGQRFGDDNAADAFMHASLLAHRWFFQHISAESLKPFQIDALLTPAKKKSGLTDAKFKRTGNVERSQWLAEALESGKNT